MQNDKNKIFIFLLCSILFTVFFFVFGQSGILERMLLQDEKHKIDEQNEKLETENKKLTELYHQYQSGTYKFEDVEKYGFIKQGSKVIIFEDDDTRNDKKNTAVLDNNLKSTKMNIKIMRYAWLAFSITVIGAYIFFTFKKENDIE
ncbi:MAG: septum formation initiator family protein [Spirochaetes bacterium]|nr:septum formation initiator family protein [Spirochaetota bacterium]